MELCHFPDLTTLSEQFWSEFNSLIILNLKERSKFMKIIISPAKSQNFSKTPNSLKTTTPHFIDKSELLINRLRKLNKNEIKNLMSISDNLASLNFNRFKKWNKEYKDIETGAAIFSFTGAVYESLSADTLATNEIKFANKHLRIISGLYGILNPLDLIMPYRLEMGIPLKLENSQNLYSFWKDILTNYLSSDILKNSDNSVINLASNEYSKVFNFKKLPVPVITPVFKENKNGKLKTIAIYAKKARGAMTRFIVKNQLKDYNQLKEFNWNSYKFDSINEKKGEWLFIR